MKCRLSACGAKNFASCVGVRKVTADRGSFLWKVFQHQVYFGNFPPFSWNSGRPLYAVFTVCFTVICVSPKSSIDRWWLKRSRNTDLAASIDGDPTRGFRHKKCSTSIGRSFFAEVVASPGASHASHASFAAQLRRLEQQIEVRHQRSRGLGMIFDGQKPHVLGFWCQVSGAWFWYSNLNRCSNVPSMLHITTRLSSRLLWLSVATRMVYDDNF